MKTVKIYKVTIIKAYMMSEQGEGFSLRPWSGNNIDYEGYDDGGKEYFLPDGYEVAMSNSESLEIYNLAGQHCQLVKKFNSPCIIDDEEIMLSQMVNKLIELENRYGSTEYKGKKYILTDDAIITGNTLDKYSDGENYFEMSCKAIDEDNNNYMVYWEFENNDEWELDMYDYDNADRVEKEAD